VEQSTFDAIVLAIWEQWTKNGLNLDDEMCEQTYKTVVDAANNTYRPDITLVDWMTETLQALGG